MSAPCASILDRVRRLLAVEASDQSADANVHLAVRVSEKLRISLTRFVGADGFATLLRRALALAKADVPSLQTVTATAQGRLEGIQELAASAEKDVEAATAITANLVMLLVTFIGESLTLRLMRDLWPDASGRKIAESEDLNEQGTN